MTPSEHLRIEKLEQLVAALTVVTAGWSAPAEKERFQAALSLVQRDGRRQHLTAELNDLSRSTHGP